MATSNPPSPEKPASEQAAPGGTPKPRAESLPHPGTEKLGIILAIVIVGFFLSLFFHYRLGTVSRIGYPLSTFLFRPRDQFGDYFSNFFVARTSFAPLAADRVLNPGWGSTVLMFRSWLMYTLFFPEGPVNPQLASSYPSLEIPWLGSQFFFLAGTLYFFRKLLRDVSVDCLWAKILALTLCSYPFLICLDRSNFESSIFVLLFAFVLLYRQGYFLWAAVFLGVIISLKPYGVVFLAIPFADRRLWDVAICIVLAVALSAGALVLLPGGVALNFSMLKASMSAYTSIYVQGNEGMYFGSSLYGMVKVWMYATHAFVGGMTDRQVFDFMGGFMPLYFRFAAVFYLVVVVVLCGFRMQFWKRIALLVCCMNLLPFICGDYRLMHLFIPMLLFVADRRRAWADGLFCVLFGLLMVPTGYVHFVFDPAFHVNPYEISDTVVLHPLLMLALVLCIVFSVLRQPVASDTALWLSKRFRRTGAAPG